MMNSQEYLNKVYEKFEKEKDQKRKNEFYQIRFRKTKIRYFKMVAMFLLIIGGTIGVKYGVNNYQQTEEKVWKEPKEYSSWEEIQERYQQNITIITEEEKKQLISEEEAKEKAIQFMEKLGYGQQEIRRIKLYSNEEMKIYMVKTIWEYEGGLEVDINAKTGEILSFSDHDLKYQHLESDQISEEEAKKIAQKLYEQTDLLHKEEYELQKIEEIPHFFQNQGTEEWNVSFCKKYDGIFNPYESVTITFLVYKGEVKLEGIKINKINNFQDNRIRVTKEEAIEIAQKSDRKITSKEVTKIEAELTFQYMNPFVYLQEKTNGKDDGTRTKTLEDGTIMQYNAFESERVLRKVWKVIIDYDHSQDNNRDWKEMLNREYYIDSTTSEIIGGSWNMDKLTKEN